MFGFFKPKLEAKHIFFELNKYMVDTIYRIRKASFEDVRSIKDGFRERVDTVFNESAALSFFLVSSAVKTAKLDRNVENQIFSFLKAYSSAYLPNCEKDDAFIFLDKRYARYFETYKNGFDETEICDVFFDALGKRYNNNDIIANIEYTTTIEITFIQSLQALTTAKKKFKIVQSGKIGIAEIKSHADEIREISQKYSDVKQKTDAGLKNGMVAKYQSFVPETKRIGTYSDRTGKGRGPFGLCSTNPIPTTSVQASMRYLKRLRFQDERNKDTIQFSRIGSTAEPTVTEGMIDIYTTSIDGKTLATIYICPYHNKDSELAPDGFILK